MAHEPPVFMNVNKVNKQEFFQRIYLSPPRIPPLEIYRILAPVHESNEVILYVTFENI